MFHTRLDLKMCSLPSHFPLLSFFISYVFHCLPILSLLSSHPSKMKSNCPHIPSRLCIFHILGCWVSASPKANDWGLAVWGVGSAPASIRGARPGLNLIIWEIRWEETMVIFTLTLPSRSISRWAIYKVTLNGTGWIWVIYNSVFISLYIKIHTISIN